MSNGLARWSQLVRKPGTVMIEHHSAVEVPPLGQEPGAADSRPGIRLYVSAIATPEPVHMIDITSTAVIAMLEGFLQSGTANGRYLTWRSSGFGPRRHDTVILRSHA
jgi:hypothetical protein